MPFILNKMKLGLRTRARAKAKARARADPVMLNVLFLSGRKMRLQLQQGDASAAAAAVRLAFPEGSLLFLRARADAEAVGASPLHGAPVGRLDFDGVGVVALDDDAHKAVADDGVDALALDGDFGVGGRALQPVVGGVPLALDVAGLVEDPKEDALVEGIEFAQRVGSGGG